jgi:hypothetical protein
MRIRACHATGSCAQQAERVRVSMSLLRAFDFSCKRALAEHHDSRLPCLGRWIGGEFASTKLPESPPLRTPESQCTGSSSWTSQRDGVDREIN